MKITFDIDTLTEKPEVLARLSAFLDYRSGIATIGESPEGDEQAVNKAKVAQESQNSRIKMALGSYGMELLPGTPNLLEFTRLSHYVSTSTRSGLTYRSKQALQGNLARGATGLPSKVYLSRHGEKTGYWIKHEDVPLWKNL